MPGRTYELDPWTTVTDADTVDHFLLVPCGHSVEHHVVWLDEVDDMAFWHHGYATPVWAT